MNFKFKIVASKKPLKLEIGDILFGAEYVEEFKKSHLKNVDIIPLRYLNTLNPWKVLRDFHIDPHPFQSEVSYHCPLLKQEYYWIVPAYILTKDIVQYLENTSHARLFEHDWDWLRKMGRENAEKDFLINNTQQFRDHILFMSRATNLLLGTGFTEMTLPTDGDGSVEEARIRLDNGDSIVVNLWFWYNK